MAFLTTDDGVKLFYRVDGAADAPLVMLSNSLATNHGMWDLQMPALLKQFRVLRYDQRGHGQSSVPDKPFAIERLGRDVLALLDEVKVQKVRFAGLSMGGFTGIWLGANAPQRLDRIALCNTATKVGPPDIWAKRIETSRKEGMAPLIPTTMERWFTAPFREREPAAVERIAAMARSTPPEGYAKTCEAIIAMDHREVVKSIRVKTLVIAGAHDNATPTAEGRYIAENVPGAKYVELPAAHISNVEAADQFTKALVDFMAA
jgi:3-oxoadipate enol-lactonase